MPGITFFIPMFAVLRTPQRTFLAMVANDNGRGSGNAKQTKIRTPIGGIVYDFSAVK
jgi:hypothetical protein